MRILCLHSNRIKYEAVKKAISDPEDIDSKTGEAEDCLAVFMAVEERDEDDVEDVVDQLIDNITDIAGKVNAEAIVLYPYVHLTSSPGSPETALQVLDMAEERLSSDYEVKRSPFGWYKAFEIDVKGHPLAELSREFGPAEAVKEKGVSEEEFEFDDRELSGEEKVKLSTAVVVGKAVKELLPEAEIGGFDFYHDQAYVDISGVTLNQDHIKQIEKKVKSIIKDDLTFEEADEAGGKWQEEIASDLGGKAQPYSLGDETVVSLYEDPFVESTGDIGAFRVLHLASAYWRGSSQNPQLMRIYTVGFRKEKELDEYLERLEAAEERSHVNLGRKLDLFFNHESSPGSPFFLPKGTVVLNELEKFFREVYFQEGYEEVRTPTIYSNELWKKSGHWDHYKDDMFFIEGEDFAMKPMNCPSHCVIYKRDMKSYRDLPLRIADFGILHRNELSGVLHGLTRVRKFQQDDAHVFCTPDQVEGEINKLIDLVDRVYDVFGLNDFHVELSTRPDDFMGDKELWDEAEESLKTALKDSGNEFTVNEGDGAFYGPKIDFHVKDSLDRSWQLGTIQLDFQMPERFDLTYEGSDGKPHKPVMIHRAILGSLERFFGVLLEHTEGNLPLWLSPEQVRLMTIADRHNKFAEEILREMRAYGIRAGLDDRMESVGKKVHDSQADKVNYMITIGDDEVESDTISVRDRDGEVEHGVEVEDFIEEVIDKIRKRE